MRQDGLRPAAPTNPDPRWPAGYMAVLREAGAQEKNIPYCIDWVRAFFARHPGRRRRDLGRPEIEAFLSELAARPSTHNWQVQQARDALEVYYERFRGIALKPRPSAPAPDGNTKERTGRDVPSAAIAAEEGHAARVAHPTPEPSDVHKPPLPGVTPTRPTAPTTFAHAAATSAPDVKGAYSSHADDMSRGWKRRCGRRALGRKRSPIASVGCGCSSHSIPAIVLSCMEGRISRRFSGS